MEEVIYFKEVFLSTLAYDTDKTKLLLIGTHQILQNVPADLDLHVVERTAVPQLRNWECLWMPH